MSKNNTIEQLKHVDKNFKYRVTYIQMYTEIAMKKIEDENIENKSNVKNNLFYQFFLTLRNYISHSSHDNKKLNESYKNLLEAVKYSIAKNHTEYIEKYNSLQISEIKNYIDTNIFVKDYIANIENEKPEINFLGIILAIKLQTFLINSFCDKYLKNEEWKKALVSISNKNNDYIGFDISILTKYPASIFNENSVNKNVGVVKQWNKNFMASSFPYIKNIIKGSEIIDDISIQVKSKIDAIRFSTIEKPPKTYEISRAVIQQMLYYNILNDEQFDLKGETEEEISIRKRPKPRKSEEFLKKETWSKIISYYFMWKDKQKWVLPENKENHFYAVRSFTRFILIEHLKNNNPISTDDLILQRNKYREYYNAITKYISFRINKDIERKIDFSYIQLDNEDIKKTLLNYNNKSFKDIYTELCFKMLERLKGYKIILDNYAAQNKIFGDFKKNDNREKNEIKSNVEELWQNLKREKSKIKGLYSKNSIIKFSLPSVDKKIKYITSRDIEEINGKIRNISNNVYRHAEGITDILDKEKDYGFYFDESKDEKKLKNREEKKLNKENKKKFYTALECALIYLSFIKYDNVKAIDNLLWLKLSHADKNNKSKKDFEHKLYIKLGEFDKKLNKEDKLERETNGRYIRVKNEKGEYINTTDKERIFISRANSAYQNIWKNKLLEKNDTDKENIFISWFNNYEISKALVNSKMEDEDKKIYYLLDDKFLKSLLDYYIKNMVKVIEWENYVIDIYGSEKIKEYSRNNIKDKKGNVKYPDSYISFFEIIAFIKHKKEKLEHASYTNIETALKNLNKTRNILFHFDLNIKNVWYGIKEISKKDKGKTVQGALYDIK